MSAPKRRAKRDRSVANDLSVAKAGEIAGGGSLAPETVVLPYVEQRGAAPVGRPQVAPSQTKVIAS